MKPKIKISWKDDEGKSRSKEYKDVDVAYRARNWLKDNGAKQVEMTVALVEK